MKSILTSFRFSGRASAVLVAIAVVTGALLLATCEGGGGGSDGEGGGASDGESGGDVPSLQVAADIPPGPNCAYGGVLITDGRDDNGNGVLDPDEVDSSLTRYECNASPTYGYQVAQLHASDMQEEDSAGVAVAISGDYAVVGAGWEDGGAGDPLFGAGAAYVFERDAMGVWKEAAILRASNAQVSDYFGYSVSISGGYIIVGARVWNAGSPDTYAGAAYVFERNAMGVWTEVAILRASDAQARDHFGRSVSISGEYAIVGAFGVDGGADNSLLYVGAAYVFERDATGVWNEVAILHASNAQAHHHFGVSVSVSGDYAVVGATGDDAGAGLFRAGAAYVFERNAAGAWNEVAILHASDTQAGDDFGHSVSIGGGYLVVGVPYEDGDSGDPDTDAGAAYVFERNAAGAWNEAAILHASDARADDVFGNSVSICGDHIIVGARGEDGGAGDPVVHSGAVYVFQRSGGAWEQTRIQRASDAQPGDDFGISVSISSGYAITGAYQEDGGAGDPANSAGAAYIFQ